MYEIFLYIADQKAQLIYAKAQDTELNDQYKIIKNYLDNKKFEVDERGLSFFKAVGHSEAKREAREYGIFASDMKYITAGGPCMANKPPITPDSVPIPT